MTEASGTMLIHTTDKNLAHEIQRGVEIHYGLFSNVVLDAVSGKYQVRVVTTMNKRHRIEAAAYAYGMIDLDAKRTLPISQKRITVEQIVLDHANQQYKDRGDRFATAAEMEMYRNDPMGMYGRREVMEILAEFMRDTCDRVINITVEAPIAYCIHEGCNTAFQWQAGDGDYCPKHAAVQP